jgi:hypothetical protein
MQDDELTEAERQRDAFARRIQLMREGKMKTCTGPQLETETTGVTLKQAEQSKAALDRRIARLETAKKQESCPSGGAA